MLDSPELGGERDVFCLACGWRPTREAMPVEITIPQSHTYLTRYRKRRDGSVIGVIR